MGVLICTNWRKWRVSGKTERRLSTKGWQPTTPQCYFSTDLFVWEFSLSGLAITFVGFVCESDWILLLIVQATCVSYLDLLRREHLAPASLRLFYAVFVFLIFLSKESVLEALLAGKEPSDIDLLPQTHCQDLGLSATCFIHKDFPLVARVQ